MIDIGQHEISALIERARTGKRLRQNLNVHQALDDPINRLLNAVEPQSYIRPHRHRDRNETLVAVSGSFDVLYFDSAGTLIDRKRLAPDRSVLIEYPAGAWHTLVARESGSVFFELKAGPYVPTPPEDFLSGWPSEGDAEVSRALEWMRSAPVGARFG
jgi:cupin fold WbuC family metalloprotein